MKPELEIVKDNTNLIGNLVKSHLQELADEEASKIQAEAKAKAPYAKIGNVRKRTMKNGYVVAAGSRKRFWAGFVEWGTKDQPAQPFMTPAAESARQRIEIKLKSLARDLAR